LPPNLDEIQEKLVALSQRIAEVDTKWAMDQKTMVTYIEITNKLIKKISDMERNIAR